MGRESVSCRVGHIDRGTFKQRLGARELAEWTPELEGARQSKGRVQRPGVSKAGVFEELGGAGEECRLGWNGSR